MKGRAEAGAMRRKPAMKTTAVKAAMKAAAVETACRVGKRCHRRKGERRGRHNGHKFTACKSEHRIPPASRRSSPCRRHDPKPQVAFLC
jgi:hypothetical protein